MDLREKPGKVQNFLELMLRLRLIAVLAIVISTVIILVKGWAGVVGSPIAASEEFGRWLAGIENVQGFWASSQYLVVAGIGCVVMFFVFGGVRSGIASIVSTLLSALALFAIGGDESLPLPMFGILTLIAIVLFIFVKASIACVLFPFVLCWLFLSAVLTMLPQSAGVPNYLVWAVISTFGFACSMAFALVAGKHLGSGVPQAGAVVKAAKSLMVPLIVGALLLISAISVDMFGQKEFFYPACWFATFVIWFLVFLVPVSSFAPWERLRAGSRRVEMKDKKKKK